jgi:hypothetical protein
MHRLAPVLLLGGVMLLANGVYAPAAPVPGAIDTAAPRSSLVEQAGTVLTEVSDEIERMRGRLEAPAEARRVQRDPFRFGRPAREDAAHEAAEVAAPAPPPPVVELPHLVAVLEVPVDGAITRTASLSLAGEVRLLKAGATLGRFLIQSVDAAHVVLQDTTTQTVYRITLR